MEEVNKVKGNTAHKVFTVIGIILCIVLMPILLANVILIVKGTINSKVPPSLFNTTPLVVLSGSMDNGKPGAIEVGDLIFVKQTDPTALKQGDVVAFMEGDYAVTHRIVSVNRQADGTVKYTTRGDANNVDDMIELDPQNVIGIYTTKINGLGDFVVFMQSTTGIICFVGIPLLLFVIYDIVRRRKMVKLEKLKQEQLKKEIENLKNNPAPVTDKKTVQQEEERDPWAYPKDALIPDPEIEKPFWPHPDEIRRAEARLEAQAPVPPRKPQPQETRTVVKKKLPSTAQVRRPVNRKTATRQVAVIKVKTVKK